MNDAAHLERTLHDVISLYPELASVALVPVGVSAFSDEATMRPHTDDEARDVVALAERFQRLTLEILGRVSVFASDEFYLVAGRTPPSAADVREPGPGRERHRTGRRVRAEFRR